jgi:hypothetical protein
MPIDDPRPWERRWLEKHAGVPDPQQQEDAIRVVTQRVIELAGALGRCEQLAERVAERAVDGRPIGGLLQELRGECRRVLWTPAGSGAPESGDAF